MITGNISRLVDKSAIVARSRAVGWTGIRFEALVYEGPKDNQTILHMSRMDGNVR